jgi:hypothetical protein
MRGLSEYVEDLIKLIYETTGALPVEIFIRSDAHPYIKDFVNRQKIGTFDLVTVYASTKDVQSGEVEYFLSIDKPSAKIKFETEVV